MDAPVAADSEGQDKKTTIANRTGDTVPRVMTAVGAGIAAGLVAGFAGQLFYAPLIGWDALALVFTVWVWAAVGSFDGEKTSGHARAEDPDRATAGIFLLLASIASLAAVGVVLAGAHSTHGLRAVLLAGLALSSVALSWFLIHTLFMLRYARLYYAVGGGISFNEECLPRYADFAYVAFTVGMTFQVSDTDITSHSMRATALRHALISYFFGAVLLATSVNLVVSLSSSFR